MAKRSSIEKQKRRENIVKLKWNKRQELRKKAADMSASEEDRHAARIALNKMPRNSCPVRLRNRCLSQGRSRGFIRKYKRTPVSVREMAAVGIITGVTKTSW